jgi:hypothetical protein
VTVERFDAGEDFAVVSARDQDLGARADGGLEDREGSSGELMLLNLSNFILARQQSGPECYIRGGTGRRTSTLSVASRAALCNTLALYQESDREH